MSLAPGDRLGAYQIVGRIGAGGMGEVYKANDTRLDRTVAIKVMARDIAGDLDSRQRFEREARAVAALSHPNICVLHDVGEHDGTSFIVMEYLDGEPLADRVRQGPMPLEQVLRYAIQIAQALAKAHHHGIVHRDIKPANVIMTKSGVKLLDFGLAKFQKSPGVGDVTKVASEHTSRGIVLGTMHYMAPEQLRGEPADWRADIFAFGALLYEMVTARRAFDGRDQASIIAATLSAEPRPIRAIRAAVPVSLARLIEQCLAKAPDDRWQSARDIELELEWISREPQVGVTAPDRNRRGILPWIVAGAAALAAVFLGMSYSSRDRTVSSGVAARYEIATPLSREPASLALSADSRQLVFAATTEGQSRLWLRRLDEFSAEVLSGTENATEPFWAANGQSIAFFADGKLKRLDLGGGPPRIVADAPIGRGGTWSADDVIVFAATTAGPLLQVSANGGEPRAVTAPGGGQSHAHRWPHFLPDGRTFVFLSSFGQADTQGIFIGSVDGSAPVRLLPDTSQAAFVEPDWLLFVRLGKLLAQRLDVAGRRVTGEPTQIADTVGVDPSLVHSAFSVSRNGVIAYRTGLAELRQLQWVDRAGKVLGALSEPDRFGVASPELSPDGRRVVVFRTQDGNADVWTIPVNTGVAGRFTFDAAADVSPIWSSDGQRIFFSSLRNGPVGLFVRSISSGAGDQSFHEGGETRISNDVSPDGRLLVYAAVAQSTGVDLWAVSTTDTRTPRPILQTPFDEMLAQVAPDGRWMAYQSTASGRMEVYVCAFPTGCAPLQVSAEGGSQPRWSADGRELFYVSGRGEMVAVRVDTRGTEMDIGDRRPLFKPRLAIGANIPGAVGTRAQYDVAPDGRFLLNTSVEGAAMPPIAILLDWQRPRGQ